MARSYYIYLTKAEWTVAWECGGEVPINPASVYLSDIRQGTMTPDEAYQNSITGVPDWVVGGDGAASSPVKVMPGAGSITFVNCGFDWGDNKQAYVSHGVASSVYQDGLILSLSTKLDGELARRLGKEACVEIRCMACLIETLDEQLGVRCRWGRVRYRDGFSRNHFLKAQADAWQHEYRLLWLTPDTKPRKVTLPPNTAKRIAW